MEMAMVDSVSAIFLPDHSVCTSLKGFKVMFGCLSLPRRAPPPPIPPILSCLLHLLLLMLKRRLLVLLLLFFFIPAFLLSFAVCFMQRYKCKLKDHY